MPTPYAPVPTRLPASLTLPQDLIDQRSAASVNQVFQPLGDGIEFDSLRLDSLASLTALKAIGAPTNGLVRHVVGYGVYTFQTASAYTQEPWVAAPTDLTPGRWVNEQAYARFSDGTGSGAFGPNVYRTIHPGRPFGASAVVTLTNAPSLSVAIPSASVQSNATSFQFMTVATGSGPAGTHIVYDLTPAMIDRSLFGGVSVTITPNAAHVGLPQLMPSGYILRTNCNTGAIQDMRAAGAFVDSTVAFAAYNARHIIGGVADQNNVVDLSLYHYSMVFTNEGGTNSLANLVVNGIQVQLSPS